MNNQWTTITVPFASGCNRDGVQYAPQELCNMLAIKANLLSIPMAEHTSTCDEPIINGVKHLTSVYEMNMQLRDVMATALRHDTHVLVIGGDHSLALGSVAGVLSHDDNVGVIWFDAHGDINTEQTSPSGNAHGMPVAALLGLCQSCLNDIATSRLKKDNIFWVGARDLDEGEVAILKQLGIYNHVFTTEYIHQVGMQQVMDDIRVQIEAQGIRSMHLSFDIDGMDPAIVSSTGTRVPNGLNQADFETFAKAIHHLPTFHTMDFVEYNPLIGDKQATSLWCQHSLQTLLQSIGFIQ